MTIRNSDLFHSSFDNWVEIFEQSQNLNSDLKTKFEDDEETKVKTANSTNSVLSNWGNNCDPVCLPERSTSDLVYWARIRVAAVGIMRLVGCLGCLDKSDPKHLRRNDRPASNCHNCNKNSDLVSYYAFCNI